MPDLNEIANAVIAGDAARVSSLVEAALAEQVSASRILEQGLTAGMAVVGRRFRANEIFVPEVLVAARAMKAGMVHLDAIFSAAGVAPVGTFVIGTVRGDIHDIGKNLVGMMLRGAGFNVVDLGVNVLPQVFVDAVRKHGAQLVGLSALLTTTMVQMKPTIDALRAAVPEVKILVGGAPVSPEYAASVGADAYGANATDAVERALEFMGRPAVS